MSERSVSQADDKRYTVIYMSGFIVPTAPRTLNYRALLMGFIFAKILKTKIVRMGHYD